MHATAAIAPTLSYLHALPPTAAQIASVEKHAARLYREARAFLRTASAPVGDAWHRLLYHDGSLAMRGIIGQAAIYRAEADALMTWARRARTAPSRWRCAYHGGAPFYAAIHNAHSPYGATYYSVKADSAWN